MKIHSNSFRCMIFVLLPVSFSFILKNVQCGNQLKLTNRFYQFGKSNNIIKTPFQASEVYQTRVPTISFDETPAKDFKEKYDGQMPLIIQDVYPDLDNDIWCDDFIEYFGECPIDFQIKRNKDGFVEIYETVLTEFIQDIQYESSHESSWYMLDESILFDTSMGIDLKSKLKLPEKYFGEDLFSHFPEKIQPKDCCVIIGGEGARSYLHADPYEWTGTNYLFEGRKLWTFLPSDFQDQLPGIKRVPPVAWDDEVYNISAGWQSTVDLYHNRMDGENGLKFDSGTDLDHNPNFREERIQFVQNEGDLILIPPGWWHQVYHLEPSIAVASQYMNQNNKKQVFRHILQWCGVHRNLPGSFDSFQTKEQIECVLRLSFAERYGKDEAYTELKLKTLS